MGAHLSEQGVSSFPSLPVFDMGLVCKAKINTEMMPLPLQSAVVDCNALVSIQSFDFTSSFDLDSRH